MSPSLSKSNSNDVVDTLTSKDNNSVSQSDNFFSSKSFFLPRKKDSSN